MDVENTTCVELQGFWSEPLHVSGKRDQVNPMLFQRPDDSPIEFAFIGMCSAAQVIGGNLGLFRSFQGNGLAVVADQYRRFSRKLSGPASIQDRPEIRPGV
jgi:hypothetical protein